MGMDADCGKDVGLLLGQGNRSLCGGEVAPRPDADHGHDATLPRIVQDVGEPATKIGEIQVAVRVDDTWHGATKLARNAPHATHRPATK